MLSSEQGTFSWDDAPAATDTKLNPQYIDWFFLKYKSPGGNTSHPKTGIAISVVPVHSARAGSPMPGRSFFTEATDEIPHAKTRIIGMQNDEPTWSREYKGPVWQVIKAAYTGITREIKK